MSAPGDGEPWRSTGMRWCKFSLVGAIGAGVQLGILALLIAAGVQYLLATGLAVEAAVLHNFAWHQNFTWRERGGAILGRLARFHLTNGAISILGNLALMRVLVGHLGLAPLPANLLSLSVCWLANFLAADRIVFLARGRRRPAKFPFGCGAAAREIPQAGRPLGMTPSLRKAWRGRGRPELVEGAAVPRLVTSWERLQATSHRRVWASPMSSTVRCEKGT